jgi:membrane protease YdiL (CAAX protease family)
MVLLDRSAGLIAWGLAATVAFRVIYFWLYIDAGRSVFAVTLLHAIVNTGRTAFPGGRKAFELGGRRYRLWADHCTCSLHRLRTGCVPAGQRD